MHHNEERSGRQGGRKVLRNEAMVRGEETREKRRESSNLTVPYRVG